MLATQDLSPRAPSWVVVGIGQEVIAYLVPVFEPLAPQEAILDEQCHFQARLSLRLISGQRQRKEYYGNRLLTTRVLEVE